VVQAATAETDEYQRVELLGVPQVDILAPAVVDLVSLLGELLDNSLKFSPPETRVHVLGHSVGQGDVVVEIHGVGLGLDPYTLSRLNTRLAAGPAAELDDHEHLGVVIVARLAGRHAIHVQVRTGTNRQTTTSIRLPSVITRSTGPLALSASPAPVDS
jgi:two-component sensor histidine kinase